MTLLSSPRSRHRTLPAGLSPPCAPGPQPPPPPLPTSVSPSAEWGESPHSSFCACSPAPRLLLRDLGQEGGFPPLGQWKTRGTCGDLRMCAGCAPAWCPGRSLAFGGMLALNSPCSLELSIPSAGMTAQCHTPGLLDSLSCLSPVASASSPCGSWRAQAHEAVAGFYWGRPAG